MEQTEKHPLLSVIVPVYNVAPYLRQCIDSIIHQTYRNLEIILVVDGGCSDGSEKICEEYASKDRRIKMLYRPHEGLVSSRKAGVAIASGEYIAYVDGDDWIEPETYQTLLVSIDNFFPDVLIYSFKEEYKGHTFICPCGIPVGYYKADRMMEEVYPKLLGLKYTDQLEVPSHTENNMTVKVAMSSRYVHQPEIYPSVWSKLVKRSLLRQTQNMVPDSVTMGEDLVCMVYTLLSARSVMITDYAPYHYQIRDDSASMSNRSFQPYQDMFDAVYSALRNSSMREHHTRQLCEILLQHVLLMRYEAFLDNRFPDLPFGNLESRRVALYGAGKFGKEVYRKTRKVFPDRIVLWVDRDYGAYRELPVEPVEKLLDREYDVVLVALLSEPVCKEIKQNLTGMGIAPDKIRYVTASPEMLEAVGEIMMGNGQTLVQVNEKGKMQQ